MASCDVGDRGAARRRRHRLRGGQLQHAHQVQDQNGGRGHQDSHYTQHRCDGTTPGKTVTTPGKTVTAPGKTVTTPAVTRTVTATQTKTVTTSTTTTPTGTQNFSGANRQNLGTIHVASQSLLRWSCAGCSGSAVTISNNPGDPGSIGVNSQNAASGETAVAAGTYTAVTVTGSGPWSFTIAPGGG